MFKKILKLPKVLLQKFLVGLIIWLVVVWILFFQIFQDPGFRKDIQDFWISPDLIYYFVIFWIVILVLVAISWFIFLSFLRYTNKNIKNLERIIIFNINTICFLIISVFTILKFSKSINIPDQTYFTWIWGVLVFWWWYKKYQRDKEIELLQSFLNRQNEYYETISHSKISKEDLKKEFKKFFNLWEESYSLQDKSYISYSLWEDFKYYIKTSVIELLFIWFSKQKNNISDVFLEFINEELKRIYYKPNNSSSYRFFLYFVEQVKKIYKIENWLLLWDENEIKIHKEKIENFIKLSESVISVPDILYNEKIKNIKSEKEKIKNLLW